jgi:NAD(P)-dependent dehydrogenase (short-subunit alcohol dehydrogenase family)
MSPRRAVVTGASSGIGAAIAEWLLEHGCSVVGVSRTQPAIAHPDFTFIPADLTDGDALNAALVQLGAVDALVHAAGFMRVGRLDELRIEDGLAMWRLHVEASVRLVTYLAPLLPDGGRIVLIGSRVAGGGPGRSQYAACKAAMVGLARSWAAELAPRGITVNVVAPGPTDTPMLRDPARASMPPRMPPIGRFVRPREVAALTGFLLSEDAGSITGQQILICGGICGGASL